MTTENIPELGAFWPAFVWLDRHNVDKIQITTICVYYQRAKVTLLFTSRVVLSFLAY